MYLLWFHCLFLFSLKFNCLQRVFLNEKIDDNPWDIGHVLQTTWKWSSWRLTREQDGTNVSFISHIHVRFLSCVISLIHVRFLSCVISLIHVHFLSCVISLNHVRFLSCVISFVCGRCRRFRRPRLVLLRIEDWKTGFVKLRPTTGQWRDALSHKHLH